MAQDVNSELERLRALAEQIGQRIPERGLQAEDQQLLLEELHTSLEELLTSLDEVQQREEALAGAQSQVESERRRYQELFELAPDAYLVTDRAGVIREANRAAAGLLGMEQFLLIGKPLVALVAPGERRAFHRQLARLEREHLARLAGWDLTLQRRRGPPVPVSATVGLALDDKGAPMGLRWLLRDQSGRKRAEARLRLLAEAGKVLGASLDYEATLLGLARLVIPSLADWCIVQLLGPDLPELTIAAHADPAQAQRLQGLANRYPLDPEGSALPARVLHSGWPETCHQAGAVDWTGGALGEIGIHSALAAPLTARGRTLGVLLLVYSQPGRQYADDDLAIADILARRAALAVDNIRLYREAQEAIQARDRFFALAAHELKTPITSLRGYAQLEMRRLLEEGTPHPQRIRRVLQVIDSQSQRLALLIRQLLDLTLIDSGQFVLNRETVDLADLARQVVASEQMGTRQHTLLVQAPEALPAAVDGPRLEQVLAGLIANAVRFSPAGAPIEVELSLPDPHRLHLSVRDHGPGIAPEQRVRVFERLYQAEGAQAAGGLGLGLYVSRRIVEAHGGRLEVESPADGGARFVATIPRTRGNEVGQD